MSTGGFVNLDVLGCFFFCFLFAFLMYVMLKKKKRMLTRDEKINLPEENLSLDFYSQIQV